MDRPIAVASYNLHSCVGLDRRLDPGRVAAVIGELDAELVALQEVDAQHRAQGFLDQWTYLEAAVGMRCIPGISLRTHRKQFGNALLTRAAVMAVRLHDISVPGCEPRGVIDADLAIGDGRLRVLCTHLGLRRGERRRQAVRLLEILAAREDDGDSDAMGTLLLGDFNEWRANGSLAPLFGRFMTAPTPATFPTRLPLLPLDRILAAGHIRLGRIQTHRSALARVASDHLPVRALLSPLAA